MLSVPTEKTLKTAAKAVVQASRENEMGPNRDDVRQALIRAFGLQMLEQKLCDRLVHHDRAISHSQALHTIAQTFGYRTWQAMRDHLDRDGASKVHTDADEKDDCAASDPFVDALADATADQIHALLKKRTAADIPANSEVPGRLRSLLHAYSSLLRDLRDGAGVRLDREAIRSLMAPDNFFALATVNAGRVRNLRSLDDTEIPRQIGDDLPLIEIERENPDRSVTRTPLSHREVEAALTEATVLRLSRCAVSIPGFKPEKGVRQSQQTRDQIGYLTTCLSLGEAPTDTLKLPSATSLSIPPEQRNVTVDTGSDPTQQF